MSDNLTNVSWVLNSQRLGRRFEGKADVTIYKGTHTRDEFGIYDDDYCEISLYDVMDTGECGHLKIKIHDPYLLPERLRRDMECEAEQAGYELAELGKEYCE